MKGIHALILLIIVFSYSRAQSHSWSHSGFNLGSYHVDSLHSLVSSDVFHARVIMCEESYSTISPFSCGPYYSPSGNYSWNESGTYLDTIPNQAGCDSIITIHLSISDLGLTITQQGNTLIGEGGVGSFTWLDCDKGYSEVGTGQEFNPPANGNYAVAGAGFACSDTSACFAFLMTAIEDIHPVGDITVYPNPATKIIYIDMARLYNDIDIDLMDQAGIKIYSMHYFQEKRIPIEIKLPTGVYIVAVSTLEKTVLKKLIVQ